MAGENFRSSELNRITFGAMFWVAHASRVLVEPVLSTAERASRRNELSGHSPFDSEFGRTRKVRYGEDAIASTRDACATQSTARNHWRCDTFASARRAAPLPNTFECRSLGMGGSLITSPLTVPGSGEAAALVAASVSEQVFPSLIVRCGILRHQRFQQTHSLRNRLPAPKHFPREV